MWTVSIVKKPPIFPWKGDYFPRVLRYYKQAIAIAQCVKVYGGEAKVEKVVKK